jgi:hypothetical protein
MPRAKIGVRTFVKTCPLASRAGFDLTFLGFVWALSASLAGVSLFGLAAILIARPFRARRNHRIANARTAILRTLVDPHIPTRVLRRDVGRATRLDVLAPVVVEVLALLRGSARQNFVECLTRAGAAGALRNRLLLGGPQDRQCAAEALAAFARGESEAALQQTWWDHDPVVRFAALRASIMIGAPPAFPDVLKVAACASARGRAQALLLTRLMAETFPRTAREMLSRVETSIQARVAIIEGLAANLDQATFEALLAVSDDSAPQIRVACLRATARRPGPVSEALIMRGLKDPDWSVRASAALAAATVRPANARIALGHLTTDEHWSVRLRAREALVILDLPATGEVAA